MDVEHNYLVDVVRSDGETVVLVGGEIDLSAVDALTGAIERARTDDGDRLVLDMSAATFIDSSGLAVLFRAFRALGQVRERVVLRAPRPAVLRTLQMTGLDGLLTIEPAGRRASGVSRAR